MEPQPNKVPYENNIFKDVLAPKSFMPKASFDNETSTKGFFDDVITPKKTKAMPVKTVEKPLDVAPPVPGAPVPMDVTEYLGKPPKTADSTPAVQSDTGPLGGFNPISLAGKILPGLKKTFEDIDSIYNSKDPIGTIKTGLADSWDQFQNPYKKKDTEGKYTIPMTDQEIVAKRREDVKKSEDMVMGFVGGSEGSMAKEVEAAAAKFGTDALGKTRAILEAGKNMIENPTLKDKAVKFFKGIFTDFYDSSHSINQFMTQAEKEIGRPLSADESAYVAARLYKGVGGKIEGTLNDFGKILKGTGEDGANGNLSTYLFAQRSEERAARGFSNPGGLTGLESKTALASLAAEVGPERFNQIQEAGKAIYSYADNLLSMLKDSGIIGDEAYNAIKKNNQKYTPFDILEHMMQKEEGGMIPSGSKAFSVASQDVVKGLKGAKDTDLIDDPINAFVRKTMKTIDLVERNNVARKLADVAKSSKLGAVVGKDTVIPKDFEAVSYFENGTKKQIAVPKDVAESMKRLTAKQADFVTRNMSVWSRALRAGATSLNMAFIVPNALRDFETATLVNKEGFNVMDWGKGFFEGVKGTLADYGMKVDDKVYQNYLKQAGTIGGYYSTYLNEVPKTVEDLTKPLYKKLLGLLNPFKLIEEAGTMIERAPRLGTFMKTLSKGGTGTEAAFNSRESTVDFAKMGDVTKIFNMWVPFVNARLQGEVNIAKALMRDAQNPKTAAWAAAKIGGMAVVPFVASYYNNIKNFPDVWKDIANYEKANNVILIYGDAKDEQGRYTQIIKFPKGDWNYFIDPIQDFLEWSNGNEPNLAKAMMNNSLMDFIPISTSPQETVGKTIEQAGAGLLPSIAKAGIEDMTNTNLYRMTPIVPQSMEKAAPQEQYQGYTPLIAVKLGRLLNMSPLKIENAVETLFAGTGRQVMNLAGTVDKPGLTLPSASVGQRFTSAAGGAVAKKVDDTTAKFQMDQATRQVVETRSAQNAVKAMLSSTPEEAEKILNDLKSNPRIVKRITDLINSTAKGMTANDKAVDNLSPIERAQYIYQKIHTAPTDEIAHQFLDEVQSKGFMTEETANEFNKLVNGQ